jgi:uncharacterized membrane protein
MGAIPMRRACLLIATLLGPTLSLRADEPVKKYQVVTPKDDGIVATGINDGGAIVGFEWVESKDTPGVIEQVPFYAQGKTMTYLPLLASYTATFPAAVSDAGRVVGRAGKAAPRGVFVPLRNQAFVWEAGTGMRGLGALKDDSASFACGISRDGRRISGLSVGNNRTQVCIWDQDGAGWKGSALPQASRFGSNTVVISDNGKYVAAADGGVPCLWSEDASGVWTREAIGEAGSLLPRGVNNTGTVVGLRDIPDGFQHAAIWTREAGIQALAEPAGYVRSEASAVNNAGVVVGMVDGPGGSKIGPNAFVYDSGRLRLLDEGGPDFTAATAINNQAQVAGVVEKEVEPEVPAKPNPPAGSK